jgi:plasmid stabilization system protein ParE
VAVEVRFRPGARTDLFDLYTYIAAQSGRERAGSYIERIEAACMRLTHFPERGTRRDDLGPACEPWASSGGQPSSSESRRMPSISCASSTAAAI